MPLAWITGAGGLIGSHLWRSLPAAWPGWTARGLTRADLELTDFTAVQAAFHHDQPALIVHCAALTSTALCEQDPTRARAINVGVTAHLAELAARIPFVFFSTDLVFDGQKGDYTETDPVHPLGVYAQTKAEAEPLVLAHPHALVLRTSLTYGRSPTGDRGFADDMRRAWAAGRTWKLFTDEYRNPMPVEVTAQAVWELVRSGQTGLFHLAGAEKLSRWQIGHLVALGCPEVKPRLESCSLRDYQGPPRPPDTSLDCAKVQPLLSFPLPRFSDWMRARHAATGCQASGRDEAR